MVSRYEGENCFEKTISITVKILNEFLDICAGGTFQGSIFQGVYFLITLESTNTTSAGRSAVLSQYSHKSQFDVAKQVYHPSKGKLNILLWPIIDL